MADKPFERLAELGPLARRILEGLGQEQSPFADLATILSGQTIQDRWFKDTTVYLDGYTFERCRFDRCQLFTEYATFVIRNCAIAPDCGIHFGGPALKIARLLMQVLLTKRRINQVKGEEGVFPKQNPDGTFTLE